MKKTQKRLKRVLEELTDLANHFEDLGFEDQAQLFDVAFANVEEVSSALKSL